MSSTQELYAANLLQHCGYPLYSPGPSNDLEEQLYQTEGFQIGDVGYVNGEGEFNPLFNISQPLPEKLRKDGYPEHERVDFPDLYRKPLALAAGHMFMTGVKQKVNPSSSGYEFTAKSSTGAVLILPSGATLSDLPRGKPLTSLQEAATRYARLWCERSEQDSLYLVTGMYKTRHFILTAFNTGEPKEEMLVKTVDGKYMWTCAFTAFPNSSAQNNTDENQTILIKGFRMTVRWSLPVVERVTETQSQVRRWITFLITTFCAFFRALSAMLSSSRKSRTCNDSASVQHVPPLTRVPHPSDTINRFLLDKNRDASVAITHDNEWIYMVEKKGLPPQDLMREDRLRDFLVREYTWDSDSNSGVVYLRSQIDTDQNSESSQPKSMTENVQVAITHIRAENVTVGLERVPVGFYVQVDIPGCPYRRTKNKSVLVYDHVIQWNDVIHLPSDLSIKVKLTVRASYGFSPMLGEGEPLHVLEKTVGELLNQTGREHAFTFRDERGKNVLPRVSLLVAVQQRHGKHQTHGSTEVDGICGCPTEVPKATNEGHGALRRYFADHNDDAFLESSVESFDRALSKCLDAHSCRAAALFNFATVEFIRYRSYGRSCHFKSSKNYYRKALELRRDDHQDRPMTLLYLARVILCRSGEKGSNASRDDKLGKLLDELKRICPEGTHARRAADLTFQTHELFKVRDSNDLEKVDELIPRLDAATQDSPDAYFDRPVRFNNLGLALQKRFQLNRNIADLDRAIGWFQEAAQFSPTNHLDKSEYLSNLGHAFLVRSQRERAIPLTGKSR